MNPRARRLSRVRPYNSQVRADQKEATRQHILDAVVAKMVEGKFRSASMDEIARAAGISPATLYRHFPNREALWDGLSAEFNRRIGGSTYPQTPQEIIEFIRRDSAHFDEHPGLVQAYFLTQVGKLARSRGRARRLQAIRKALAGVTRKLDNSKREQVIAVIAYLASLQSWMTMTSEFNLSGAEVGEAVAWAIQTLLDAVEKETISSGSQIAKWLNTGT